MTEQPKKPIRLTRARALALLAVFEIGSRDVEESLRSGMRYIDNAEEGEALRARDQDLAAARDGAAIIRARYAGGDKPTEPTPTLF